MARREAIPAGLGNGARVLKRFHGVGWLFGCVVNVDDPRGIFTVVWSDAVSRDYEFREAWRMLDAGAAALPAGERAVPTVVSARGRGADAPGAGGAAEDSFVEGDLDDGASHESSGSDASGGGASTPGPVLSDAVPSEAASELRRRWWTGQPFLEMSPRELGAIGGSCAGHIGDNKFVAAESGGPRSSKCQWLKCGSPQLPLSAPRIGKKPPSLRFGTSPKTTWYHIGCAFRAFRSYSWRSRVIRSVDDFIVNEETGRSTFYDLSHATRAAVVAEMAAFNRDVVGGGPRRLNRCRSRAGAGARSP